MNTQRTTALVAGGGPVGAFTAIALARRGYGVTLVDRDPGPDGGGPWVRKGVMQARAPHAYRPGVRQAFEAEVPELLEGLRAAGARLDPPPGMPPHLAPMFARRPVFETVLREAARREVRWRTGHVDDLLLDGHVVRGAVVDGDPVWADIVVVATGRASHLGEHLRGPREGGACGFSYLFRTYAPRSGSRRDELPMPAWANGPGYVSLAMPADAGTHHLLLSYPTQAPEFDFLRTNEGFELAARSVPNLATWSDPDRFEPITDVEVGGNLTNTYRLQGPALGMPPATGLFFLGDTVLTTNPAAGHNLALLLPHAQVLLAALDDPARDFVDASLDLDRWAEERIRPWYEDHVHWDASLLQRYDGGGVELDGRIPSDVICAAAAADPSLMAHVGPYLGMLTTPAVLDAAQDRVRQLLATGWTPETPGPTAAQLRQLVPTGP